jgi:hypothetical protein
MKFPTVGGQKRSHLHVLMIETQFVGNFRMLTRLIISLPRYRWYFLTLMVALVPLIRFTDVLANTPAYNRSISEYIPTYFDGSHRFPDSYDFQVGINFLKVVFPCWVISWFVLRTLEWNPQKTPIRDVVGSTLKIGAILLVAGLMAVFMMANMMFSQYLHSTRAVFERGNSVYYYVNFGTESYASEGVYICDVVQRECEAVFSRRNSFLTIEELGDEIRILENGTVLYQSD